jgi:hypothetical protein
VFSWDVLVWGVVGEGSFQDVLYFFGRGETWEKREDVRREGSTQAKRVSGQVECGRDETVHKTKQENPNVFFIKWEQVWSNGRGRGKPGQ